MSPFEMVEMMRDSQRVSRAFGGHSHWNSTSLYEGYPGVLLLLSVMQLKDSSFDRVVHEYVLAIKKELEAKGLSSLSMFSGAAGICFSLLAVSMGGSKYEKMRESLHEFIFQNVDSHYLKPLDHLFHMKRSANSMLYDVVEGVAGLGGYALENLSDPRFEKLAKLICKALTSLTNPISVGGFEVPGWHSLSDNMNGQFFKSQNGYFNLGLAHGITGVLSFLSIALMKGIQVPNQCDAIKKITKWVKEWSFDINNMIRWPYQICWEEEVGESSPLAEPSRDGWCYGVPGISRAMYLAGKALNNIDLKSFAMKAFLQLFERSEDEWKVNNPGLCHGLGGTLLIAKVMSKEDGGEELDQRISELQNQISSSYNPEIQFGFNDLEQTRFPALFKTATPGFLEGATGTLLALLPLPEEKHKWYTPLMIHG